MRESAAQIHGFEDICVAFLGLEDYEEEMKMEKGILHGPFELVRSVLVRCTSESFSGRSSQGRTKQSQQ